MIVLTLFSFLAGVVTILSPCILPILPIILSSSVDATGKRRPFGVVIGFILSFTFFTLFLSTIVRYTRISAESLRIVSIFILVIFGISFFIPKIQLFFEQSFTSLTRFAPQGKTKRGFLGGLLIGFSLGLLWTPCVGPILASVISLAISGQVSAQAFIITFAYSLGTAIPMFGIMVAGSQALKRVPWLLRNTGNIQKAFGILMVLTAIGILFNVDRKVQTWILNTFPQYGVGLTKLEDNVTVRDQLSKLSDKSLEKIQQEIKIGMPMNDVALPQGPQAPEIISGGQWFNSEPLTLQQLRGKVVIIDFWTYSCINCQRTLPYLRSWWSKYKDKGLVIIGVHSPEFEFEKNPKNLTKAIKDFNLEYPIVQDNDFSTWRAYENIYWPAKYFINKDGYIRYTHFGEGAYDESEKVIQKLLAETGAQDVNMPIKNPDYQVYAETPETYLGYSRIDNFGSYEQIHKDQLAPYTVPTELIDNQFAYSGNWTVMSQYAQPQKGATLIYNFSAKAVFLVMRPRAESISAKVKVYVDGKMQFFGEDTVDGFVTVDSDRLYNIISLPTPGRHILKLDFQDDNAELYAFTFG